MKITSILICLVALSGTVQPINVEKEASAIDSAKILAKNTHAIMAAARDAHKNGKDSMAAAKKAAH